MYAPLNEEITSSGENLTIEELNDEEVKTLIPAIVYTCFLMPCGVIGNTVVIYVYSFRLYEIIFTYNITHEKLFCNIMVIFILSKI